MRLPLFRKLTDGEFCSAGHRKVFQEDQSRLAVERLMETHKQCNRVTTEVRANIEREQLVLQGPPMASPVKMFVAHATEPSWGMLSLDPLAYDFPSTPAIPNTDRPQEDRTLLRAPNASISSLMTPAQSQRQERPDPIQGRWDAGVLLTPPGTGLEPEFESRAIQASGMAEMSGILPLPMISVHQNHAVSSNAIEPIRPETRTWLPLPQLEPLESPFGADYEPPMAGICALSMPGGNAPQNGSLANTGSALPPVTGQVALPLRSNPRISGLDDFTEPGSFTEPPMAGIRRLSMPEGIALHNASLPDAGRPVLPTSGDVAVQGNENPRICGIEPRSEQCLPLVPPDSAGADPVSWRSEPRPSMALRPSHVLPAPIAYKKPVARIRANARLVRLQPRGPIEPPPAWGAQAPDAKDFARPALGQPAFARPAAEALTLSVLRNPLPLEPGRVIEPPHTWGLKVIGECAFGLLGIRRPEYFPQANTPGFRRREKVPVPLSPGVNIDPDRSSTLRSMAPPEPGVSKPACPPSRLTPLHVVRGAVPVALVEAAAQAARTPQQRVQAFLRTRGLQMVLMLAPVMILLTFWPGEQPTQAAAPNGSPVTKFVNARLTDIKTAIQNRAGIEMLDDFRTGLDNWEGRGSLSRSWSYDQTGFVKPGPLALYKPSLGLSEYSFEFLGQIDRRALGWVYRAQDMHNYHVAKLVMLRPGPLPTIGLIRYSVINGRETRHVETVLPLNVHSDTIYRVRLEARGNDFSLYVQNQMVQFWSDWRLPTGGVGFFSGHGEQSRIRWMQISHQYDAIGKLCAYFAPMAVVTYNLQPTMGAESK